MSEITCKGDGVLDSALIEGKGFGKTMDDPCWVILTWTHTPKYQEWEETSIIKDLVLYMYAIQSEGTEEKSADQIVRKIPRLSSLTCFVTADITRIESRVSFLERRETSCPAAVRNGCARLDHGS